MDFLRTSIATLLLLVFCSTTGMKYLCYAQQAETQQSEQQESAWAGTEKEWPADEDSQEKLQQLSQDEALTPFNLPDIQKAIVFLFAVQGGFALHSERQLRPHGHFFNKAFEALVQYSIPKNAP